VDSPGRIKLLEPSRAAPTRSGPCRTALAISAGAALLLWPAALNGYPIVFSDTGGLLEMGFGPSMGWDKPWVYGPLLALLSLHATLWLPCAAQAALLSYTLWLTAFAVTTPTPARHVLLCLILALGTSAPWVAATLMPDLFTPVVVLAIAGLSLGTLARPHRIAAGVIAATAIAVHLSHLILAAACILAVALLRRTIPWRPLASLAAALAFLAASNGIGHGRFGISPYGSVFALARLIGDGPARDYLAGACPQAGYRLCAWRDQLTDDSDQFLWDPASPFWADPAPLPVFAAEASRIVAGTIAAYPLRVAEDAIRNGARQLGRVTLGDTLVPDYLAEAVRPRLARWLPADALSYDTSLQAAGELLPRAQPLIPLLYALLGLGGAGCALFLIRGLRRPTALASDRLHSNQSGRESAGQRYADLAALILIALAANALATGALSTVHDRYQVRIAWLVLLPPTLALLARPRSSRERRRAGTPSADQAASLATSSGDIRTSAS
jgi:hypothetical protein